MKRSGITLDPQAGHGQKHHALMKKANIPLYEIVVLLLAIGKSILDTLVEGIGGWLGRKFRGEFKKKQTGEIQKMWFIWED